MKLDFSKYADGLVPAIVQDDLTGAVLMLGFMDQEALDSTLSSGKVTFYSRSRRRIWTKGETSGHYLELRSMTADCDNDTLLITATPHGPVCHTGSATCFGGDRVAASSLEELQRTIDHRLSERPDGSYIAGLAGAGLNKIAQKVGEEAVELVIAAKDDDLEAFSEEAADLLFHYLVLLRTRGITLGDVCSVLEGRRN